MSEEFHGVTVRKHTEQELQNHLDSILIDPATVGQPAWQRRTIELDGDRAIVTIGGQQSAGALELIDAAGNVVARLDATGGGLRVGSNGIGGAIRVFPRAAGSQDDGAASVLIDGDAGDIVLRNADLAEDFPVAAPGVAVGTVMVFDEYGALRTSSSPYDRRVAGVVSGAGTERPGIVLGRRPNLDGRVPVALVGRVYCRADASECPISVGDMLTTSDVPGHAMVATDRDRAFGSVLGKALAPLAADRALLPILVALQ